jgi:catechol 2,3-dioxygenase-like lactoylglutathione lyase family enzyme
VRERHSPPLGRVVETALYVDDYARSCSFYVDLLGARILLESPRLIALDVNGETILLLFKRGAAAEASNTPGGVVPGHDAKRIQHLAFAIARGDLDAWTSYLEASGIPIESRVKWSRGGESIYVRDPDGHSVEFITPGLWETY